MVEIECPHCGKVTRLEVADGRDWSEEHRQAIERGERPKFLCFMCWTSLGGPKDAHGIPPKKPSDPYPN